MEIWKNKFCLDDLTERAKDTAMGYMGIEFLEIGDDYITGRIPVDKRTVQFFGRIHGGVSVLLAETLGSIGATMCADLSKVRVVGMEINANHVRGVTSGWVTGKATPFYIGKGTQVWDIKMYNDDNQLTCISRLTTANIPKEQG